MKYQAVAFVQGLEYARMAAYSMPRASTVLGQEVQLVHVPPGEDLWLAKLSVIEEFCTPVLCLDVDLVLCNWDWSKFKLDRFNAVVDYPMIKWRHGARIIKEHYPVETSVNGGLWYAPYTGEVRAMFKRARELLVELKDFRYAFGDQAALNKAIHECRLPVNFLPLSFNHQVLMNSAKKLPPGTHVGHAIGQAFKVDDRVPNLRAKSARLIELLENNPHDTPR
jgi:hypothetical protein